MIWPYCIWSALQYDWQKVFVKDTDLRKRNLSHSLHIDFIKVNIRQSKNHCTCITEQCSEEWDFKVYILYYSTLYTIGHTKITVSKWSVY